MLGDDRMRLSQKNTRSLLALRDQWLARVETLTSIGCQPITVRLAMQRALEVTLVLTGRGAAF